MTEIDSSLLKNRLGKRVILMIVILMGWFSYNHFIDNRMIKSTSTFGLVTYKYDINAKDYFIKIKLYGDGSNYMVDKRILVEDRNVWNLLEEGRFYGITFNELKNGNFVLEQIDQADEFGKNEGKLFEEK
ncbi:hypothetical protein HNQ80_004935 [Anaerosolibacter carboniphilus]|uniref:Uncharacterized protein n=1 Tax=Anaerosolibacter carboniphilus TaxID=1417629 RepID=A0A841L3L4_9FIRM|nr:hypothetical protein [Anaerosolibacter carboniphilus]MBB6218760.1 hypothetical protein [Anaerosolibacter carboniphilus]